MRDNDGKLLNLYYENGDEDAFGRLFRRHSGMVHEVCRRYLGDNAEDGVQLVFMLLLRKGKSLRGRVSIASWLYGASLNISKSTARSLKRQAVREREFADMKRPMNGVDVDSDGMGVDDEIARLPKRLQESLLLCGVEGITQAQAAEVLGCTEGQVRARIKKARDIVRNRLMRRGGTVGGVTIATIFGGGGGIPVSSACEGAVFDGMKLYAAGNPLGLTAAQEDVLREVSDMMWWVKVKLILAQACAVVFIAAGVVYAGGTEVSGIYGQDKGGEDAERGGDENKAKNKA